ncbi:type 2 phosphatidylinositol 4,5-bisphosphate 4-phosphatase [Galendromus occidentalis]|uniref:Phosphatidylinositol-4,5-bisphosphate 4-phosphatase n=1 Tax=Galendromus occidentalis TaxID=34638 RepID=A0AAJ6QMB5_9ACAR|nr:type 2 phosphatidylinositol 4,5-bisphosphate 4-phosphatase [Galendromus occidentalis]
MQSERTPLLKPEALPGAPPPPYSEIQQDLGALGESSSTDDYVRCEVCSYSIEKTTKKNKKVITCPRCNESTALGPPDEGKSYLRCPECNCLLIVRQGVLKTICPRENCKTTISVKTGKTVKTNRPSTSASSLGNVQRDPQYRIVCGHCHNTFIQEILPTNNRIVCALCNRESNIGERGARGTAVMYIGIGLACIIVCVGLMATTMGLRHNAGYWYIYLVLLAVSILLILRGLLCLCMRHSTLEIANPVA